MTRSSSPFELAWDANCATGESPTWDDNRQILWFCDSPSGRIYGLHPASGARYRYELPEPVGSLGLCEGSRLVVALRRRVVLFDLSNGALETVAELPDVPDFARLNDGKVGPDRAFWVGSVDLRSVKQDVCRLYRVTVDGRVEVKSDGFKSSNGLAWSPDERWIYHSDSRGPWIDRWHFDRASGRIWDRKRFATLSSEEGRPDGAACDEQGNYWSAGVSAGRINQFGPDSRLLAIHGVPVHAPTMPCFAPGSLYVTSLWAGLPPEAVQRSPLSGALFRMGTAARGAPQYRFPEKRASP